MNQYTKETGPMPPTDSDRLRAALALERIPAVGVTTGSADKYGLFRIKMHGHRGPDPIILSPGVEAIDLNVFSSFWVPSLVGSGENRLLLGAFDSEPVLEVTNKGSKRILNPLAMTDDPDTQIWLANISLSGLHRVGSDGTVQKPDKILPALSLQESELVYEAVYGEIDRGFDFSIFSRKKRKNKPTDIEGLTVKKRMVKVDPSLAGTEVYVVVPYVPGRGNRNHTWFNDAVVFDSDSPSMPIEREVVTQRMALANWIEVERVRREKSIARIAALAR